MTRYNCREGTVVGTVQNGALVTATGQTHKEFVHVCFDVSANDAGRACVLNCAPDAQEAAGTTGWLATWWEGYTIVERLEATPTAQAPSGTG